MRRPARCGLPIASRRRARDDRFARPVGCRSFPAMPAPENPLDLARPAPLPAGAVNLVKVASVAAPRPAVWQAWTDAAQITRFLGQQAVVEPWPGGRFEILFAMDNPAGQRGSEGCRVLAVAPERLLSFTWNAPPTFAAERSLRTWVVVDFADVTGGTRVTLTHLGWPADGAWPRVLAYFDAAWSRVFTRMEEALGVLPADAGAAQNEGRIDYLEFRAPDLAAAKAFFAGVFGWQFTDYGPDYTSFCDGRLNGGIGRGEVSRTDATSPNPIAVIYARDLETTLARIQQAGGRVTAPPVEFPGGRRFQFTDPNGLELAVWSDRRADGSPIA